MKLYQFNPIKPIGFDQLFNSVTIVCLSGSINFDSFMKFNQLLNCIKFIFHLLC